MAKKSEETFCDILAKEVEKNLVLWDSCVGVFKETKVEEWFNIFKINDNKLTIGDTTLQIEVSSPNGNQVTWSDVCNLVAKDLGSNNSKYHTDIIAATIAAGPISYHGFWILFGMILERVITKNKLQLRVVGGKDEQQECNNSTIST